MENINVAGESGADFIRGKVNSMVEFEGTFSPTGHVLYKATILEPSMCSSPDILL